MNADKLAEPKSLRVADLDLVVGDQCLVSGLNFSLSPGEGLRVIGPNGAGKSTLLAVVAGLAPYQSGEVSLGWQQVRGLSPGELSQQVSLLRQVQRFTYPLSVAEVFESHGKGIDGEISVNLRVPELANKRLPQLSGGELQRLFLALTLMRETWLTLLDEPLASQDDQMQEIIVELLRDLMSQGRSFMVATHLGLEELPALSIIEA
jgi:ABC-type cobalamin/Fe3+-siderophores transport system ATPase subunit